MRFAEPYWLFIGLFACAAIASLYMRFDRRQAAALSRFAAGHLLNQLTASFSPRRRRLKRSLILLGVGLLFVALARPQWGFRWEETKRRGIDILFAVDTSKSMLAQDVKPDRLTRAKLAVTDLVSKLDGDRIGLIAFAGSAFLQSPLTLDYDAFRQALDALDTGIIPRGGTNVASAIREAQDAFGSDTNNQKILVLITDGEDLEAQGVEAAKAAAREGLKIYAVGVGTATGELVPVPSEDGGTEFAKDRSGQLVKSRLDEAALKEIAQATGGTYQPLGQRGEGLEAIYQQSLAPLPKQELMSRRQKVYIERFQWPLAAGLACLLLEMLIGTRKRLGAKRRFAPVPPQTRAGALRPAAATVIALLAVPAFMQASPQTAERAYEKGNFEKAQQEYKEALAKNPDAPALHYNHGAAAYKAGEYAKAAPAFEQSLQTDQPELQQLAYYNLGNAHFRLGEQSVAEKPQETIKTWQEALQAYEAALKLNPNDADAKYNRDLVKKKLEQLQQQQQEQQQKQQDQQQNEQQQDQQKQQQQGGGEQEQQQPQSSDSQQAEAKAGEENQDQQKPESADSKQDGKPDQQQANNREQEGDKQDGQKTAGNDPEKRDEEKKDGKGEQQPQLAKNEPRPAGEQKEATEGAQPEEPRAPGEMSKQEARALLDSLQRGERRLPMSPADEGAGTPQTQEPTKDW